MEIIDFHAHIYPEKIAKKAVQGVGSFYGIPMDGDGTVHALLREGKKRGCAVFWCSLLQPSRSKCILSTILLRNSVRHMRS